MRRNSQDTGRGEACEVKKIVESLIILKTILSLQSQNDAAERGHRLLATFAELKGVR